MTTLESLLTAAKAKGTDRQFIEWTQRQPSALGGDFDQWVHGEGRSIDAHVRRASTFGTGYKAPYSAIPLQDAQHRVQHRSEALCLETFKGGKWPVEDAKAYFDALLVEHLERWLES